MMPPMYCGCPRAFRYSTTLCTSSSPTNAPCNNSVYATLVPEQYRLNGLVKIVNDFWLMKVSLPQRPITPVSAPPEGFLW